MEQAYSFGRKEFHPSKGIQFSSYVQCTLGYVLHISCSVFKRRSNFQGITLIGLIGIQTSFMELNEKYRSEAPYFQSNQTYKVNTFTYGTINDVVEIMAERLNMTFNLYKQKVMNWGDISIHSNGSTIATGIVGEVYKRNIDILVGSLSMTKSRASHLAFLHPIASEISTVAISSKSVAESFDFVVFLKPLHPILWSMVLSMAIVITIIKSIIIQKEKASFYKTACMLFWSTLMTFFGGAFQAGNSNKESYKIVILISLLSGFVIWTSYNAFLTSEILVVDKMYPFNDLEDLSKTNWKYVLYGSIVFLRTYSFYWLFILLIY